MPRTMDKLLHVELFQVQGISGKGFGRPPSWYVLAGRRGSLRQLCLASSLKGRVVGCQNVAAAIGGHVKSLEYDPVQKGEENA